MAETTTVVPVDTLIGEAIASSVHGMAPAPIGDRSVAITTPPGYQVHTIDVTQHEERPRHKEGEFRFIEPPSWAAYLRRHEQTGTTVYAHDCSDLGPRALMTDVVAVTAVLDDHPPATETPATGRRRHKALLVLRPTPEAKRWASVIGNVLNQEGFLDLIDDGIGEILHPDGADLRDVISNLHAVRSASITSVRRTGGDAEIVMGENVELRGGTVNRITVPETLRVVFLPWLASPRPVQVMVKIKPQVSGHAVAFRLEAPDITRQIAQALREVVADADDLVDPTMLWTD